MCTSKISKNNCGYWRSTSSVVLDSNMRLEGPLLCPNRALLTLLLFNCIKLVQITVSFLSLLYIFLFEWSKLRQNFSKSAVIALLCLKSHATRKRLDGLCFCSAEETPPCSTCFVFKLRYSTGLSWYMKKLFFSTRKQIRRGERQQGSGTFLLPFLRQKKMELFWKPAWNTRDSCCRKTACLDQTIR